MKTISRDELKKMMDDKEDFVLIDARTHEGFNEGHLPGAVKIPADHLGERAVRKYGRNRTIVTYCSGLSCESSTIAARKLEKFGFTTVLDFTGGLEDWRKAGYPLEKS
jgi:rhodanese-related sulfurtransferase